MWARVVECMLGVWLLLSPFIFGHSPDATALWAMDFTLGGVVVVLSLASYWHRTRWAHWLIFPIGCGVALFARFSATPPLPPGLQNEMLLGILLAMMSIVPNHASRPPAGWLDSDEKP